MWQEISCMVTWESLDYLLKVCYDSYIGECDRGEGSRLRCMMQRWIQ